MDTNININSNINTNKLVKVKLKNKTEPSVYIYDNDKLIYKKEDIEGYYFPELLRRIIKDEVYIKRDYLHWFIRILEEPKIRGSSKTISFKLKQKALEKEMREIVESSRRI
ncbi:MAG: hypothetical protein QW046_04305 [Candidatus Micrarchaeaceae archaeon]